ncbi:hypothetical protein GVN16_19860, partial [Emticicia sp. CRIBPO]|uniref:NPCBM/NEW2 domain-containing protein n=1 Tax=Emticicia sp. CRIBPO TaxID=2683258 RepID=UPI00197AB99B
MNKLITHLTMCVMLILYFSSGFAQTAPDFSGGHLRELYLEGTGNGYQAANILYPFDGSVIQRQSDGKANLSFCAQIGYGFKNSQMYDYSLRLTKLDLFSGLPQSPFTTITNFSLSLSNVVGDVATINSFINVNQGWYLAQLIISLKNGGGEFIAAHIKFGIGDTFIIAGQSNARGFHGGWDRFSDGSGELISYDNTLNNSMLPDASRVIGAFKLLVTSESVEANKSNREYFKSKILNGGMPFFRPFIKLDLYNPYSTENGINYYERGIYPFGLASWCWAPFGKKYIETYQIPVQFFNTAIDGSNISEWQKGAAPKAGFYNNMYDGLFSLIQFQGNILGHKAILWHQGESDVQIGTSNSNYKTKLESLVNNLQNDYDPWQPGRVWAPLNWVISKVSHSNQYNPSTQQIVTITNDPTNIKGAQINATPQSNGSVKITGIDSDSYGESYRAPYGKIHFTGPTHSLIADMWKNMNLQNLTPKIGQQGIAPISITYNTGTNQYTLTPPAGKGTYYWVKNEESINSASIITGNGQLVVSSGGLLDRDVYTCYYKNPYGTNFLMCQPFIVPNNYDRYSSLEATTVNTFSSSGETKIATVSSSNVSWSSNITYDNPANTGWINILSNNTGFIGNSGLVIQTNSNSGSQRSGKVVLNGNDGNGNYFTKQINIVQNASGAIFPLVSLTPTNSSFEWQGYGNAKFNGTSIDANTLQIGGVQYFQGIGTHSPSIIKYSLSNQYSNFFGKVGRDDEADNTYDSGKVEFVIKGDGVVLWTSQIHRNNTTAEPFSVNISGKNELELIVNALDDNYFDHADWVDLYLTTSGGGGCSTPTNPSNVSASASSITSGQSTTLSASCSVGTITWSTGQTGASVSVSPTVSTTYQVSCVNGSCQSGTVPVSITVNPSGGGGACSAISNNLTMGTWTVTGQPLVARYFHGQYWLTQKVSSSPDEFVVRGAAMLQRSDVSLNNSSYY